MATTNGNHDLFVVFVVLHVVSAVVGFGAIAFSGIYAGTARHLDKAGAAVEARRFFSSPNWAAFASLAVPFFGAAALFAGGRSSDFGHFWVPAALVLWLIVAGLFTGVVRPGERLLAELLAGDTPDPTLVEPIARRLSLAAAACDVGFVVALGLMVWQP